MMKITSMVLLVIIFLVVTIGCEKVQHDIASKEIANKLLANNGGVSLLYRTKKKELINDIFHLREQFMAEFGQIDSEETKREWFLVLGSTLSNIKLDDKDKYLVSDSRFIKTFKQIYKTEDTADDLWGDHDFDGDPDWHDINFQSSK